ncbi:MAG TPA: hypothetical protein DD733_05590 [Clostridiales bacterium]|nr:CotH kinase family protein [Eubacteriales bacterium]HBR31535.1 hypothetical protein [Clostridiales bacterium]
MGVISQIKELKLPFKKRLYVILCAFVFVGVVVIYSLCNNPIDTPAITTKPVETLVIKAKPIGDSYEALELFTARPSPSGTPIKMQKGLRYAITVESSFEAESEISIYYNEEDIIVSQNSNLSIEDNCIKFISSGKTNIEAELVCINSTDFLYGLTIESNEDHIAYVLNSDFLLNDALHGNKNNEIILLKSIVIDGDYKINAPCRFLPNNNNLTVKGDFIFDTETEGRLIIENDSASQIKADRFFAEAKKCDIEIGCGFITFDDDIGYYLNARSYNGKMLETDCRVIKNEVMLLDLIDADAYPRLNANTKIIVSESIDFISDNITIPVPVSFQIDCKVNSASPIIIKTWDEGIIGVEITNNEQTENLLKIEAPNCDMYWSGSYVPSASEVAERMNVRSYNDEDISLYGLGGKGKGTVLSFSMYKTDSKLALEDLEWSVEGNVIATSVSYLVSEQCLKNAVVNVSADNGTVSFNEECRNPDNSINLLKNCLCTITDSNGNKRTYSVRTSRIKCNLPVVTIQIDGSSEISSKEVYKSAVISIEGTTIFPSLEETEVNIRGRGNSTWKWDKKPYKLKFNTKTSIIGLTAAKEWVLLSNYSDKTLIRNYIAMEMGRTLDNLEFTPTQYPVDLFVNGTYRGVYSLGEQIEQGTDRVEIEKSYDEVDTGYLLEVGGADEKDIEGRDFFHVGALHFVTIQSPNTSKLSKEAFNYIKEYLAQADAAVVSLTNYEDYIDIDSLIDWFILHELTYNLDSGFRRSCFMTKSKGGKLKMGPIWDFDLALGNFLEDNPKYDDWASEGEEGGYVRINWMNHFLKDESFRSKLKARWDEVKKPLLSVGLKKIDEMSALIEPSQIMNFSVWKIWDKRAGSAPRFMTGYNTYEKQIKYLKDFLQKRYEWMDENI